MRRTWDRRNARTQYSAQCLQLETADLLKKNIYTLYACNAKSKYSCQQQCRAKCGTAKRAVRGMEKTEWTREEHWNTTSKGEEDRYTNAQESCSTCECALLTAQPTDGIRSLLKNRRTYVYPLHKESGREEEEGAEENTHKLILAMLELVYWRACACLFFCSRLTVHISIVIIRKTIYKFYIICIANISTAKWAYFIFIRTKRGTKQKTRLKSIFWLLPLTNVVSTKWRSMDREVGDGTRTSKHEPWKNKQIKNKNLRFGIFHLFFLSS